MMAAGAVVPKKLALENEAWSRVDDFPKPTIAAVSGLAFGGGLELAVCCDLIVAEEGARVALPEIKLGVFPGSRRHHPGDAPHRRGPGEGDDVLRRAVAGRDRARLGPRQPRRAEGRGARRRGRDGKRALAAQPNVALQLCKRAVDLAFDMPRTRRSRPRSP